MDNQKKSIVLGFNDFYYNHFMLKFVVLFDCSLSYMLHLWLDILTRDCKC